MEFIFALAVIFYLFWLVAKPRKAFEPKPYCHCPMCGERSWARTESSMQMGHYGMEECLSCSAFCRMGAESLFGSDISAKYSVYTGEKVRGTKEGCNE